MTLLNSIHSTRLFVVALLAPICISLLTGCGRSDAPDSDSAAREFAVRGAIRGIAPDRQTLEIEHEAIPNYMPAMTMPFTAKDAAAAKDLKIGDAVSFRMVVTEKEAVIDRIQKIDAGQLRLPAPTPVANPVAASARLRAGDPMPDFTLIDHAGQTITRETFNGRPLLLTFIFTRCPIPNFCPLMNRNLAELQDAIKGGSGAVAETRLLSISFDPEFDTPEVLKDYAAGENADPAIWRFATGAQPQLQELTSRFSVHVQPEGGTISHGLATALIDRTGRIVEIWRGNGWKPHEVLSKLAELESRPAS